jgi:hypothetical protein
VPTDEPFLRLRVLEQLRKATVSQKTFSDTSQVDPLERAIIEALLEVTHDLRLTVDRDELWPLVYARVTCTEAEFWSTMETVLRILKRQLAHKRAHKRAHLSIVR